MKFQGGFKGFQGVIECSGSFGGFQGDLKRISGDLEEFQRVP